MTTESNKKVAMKYFESLGDPMEALKLFAPDAKHHNPLTPPGMKALMESIIQVQASGGAGFGFDPSKAKFDIEHVVAEGDIVMVHTSFGPDVPGKLGGMRQAHLFRFEGDKIAEYWDITQMLPTNSPNVSGLP